MKSTRGAESFFAGCLWASWAISVGIIGRTADLKWWTSFGIWLGGISLVQLTLLLNNKES